MSKEIKKPSFEEASQDLLVINRVTFALLEPYGSYFSKTPSTCQKTRSFNKCPSKAGPNSKPSLSQKNTEQGKDAEVVDVFHRTLRTLVRKVGSAGCRTAFNNNKPFEQAYLDLQSKRNVKTPYDDIQKAWDKAYEASTEIKQCPISQNALPALLILSEAAKEQIGSQITPNGMSNRMSEYGALNAIIPTVIDNINTCSEEFKETARDIIVGSIEAFAGKVNQKHSLGMLPKDHVLKEQLSELYEKYNNLNPQGLTSAEQNLPDLPVQKDKCPYKRVRNFFGV